MKKNIILFTFSLFLLGGCSRGELPTTNNQETGTAWTEDEKIYMQNAIGKVLPQGPFSNERQSEGYIDEVDNAYTFYMFDQGSGDVCNEYGLILENNGYYNGGSDDTYGYPFYFYYQPVSNSDSDYIYIQCSYFPGNENLVAGFELVAWIYSDVKEDEGVTGEISSWTNDEITIMMDAIGTTLPEGPFSSERQSEGYVDEYDGAYTFYMFDPSSGNVCAQYASILEDEGYTSDGTDNSYGYTLYFYYLPVDGSNTDLIYVQFGYYPGDDEYAPGIDLYAWIYSDAEQSGGNEGTTGEISSWTSDEITIMMDAIGTTLPEGPFSSDRESEGYVDEYDGSYTFYMFDPSSGNVCAQYASILSNAGFDDDGSDDSYGYTIYNFSKLSNNDELICVQFSYYPGDDEYEAGIDLYAWIYSEGEGEAWMYESWPSAEIASFLNGLTSLPEVPGTGFDLYDYDGALFLYAETESNIESTYTNILVNAGWTVDDSEYDTYGIIAISSSNDVEICFYYDFDYGYFILMAYAI